MLHEYDFVPSFEQTNFYKFIFTFLKSFIILESDYLY